MGLITLITLVVLLFVNSFMSLKVLRKSKNNKKVYNEVSFFLKKMHGELCDKGDNVTEFSTKLFNETDMQRLKALTYQAIMRDLETFSNTLDISEHVNSIIKKVE